MQSYEQYKEGVCSTTAILCFREDVHDYLLKKKRELKNKLNRNVSLEFVIHHIVREFQKDGK